MKVFKTAGRGTSRRDFFSKTVSWIAVVATTTAGRTLAGETKYEYDPLGRVTKVTYLDGSSSSFTYDKVGNRVQTSRSLTGGPTVIQVSSSGDLRSLANAVGYSGAANATFQFEVPANVTLSGASGTGRGLDTGAWPAGVTLTLIVYGNVYGGGGAGGNGNSGSGGNGGDAIYIQAPITITVASSGSVKGGGGGGAGGAPKSQGASGLRPGSGGGGGFPNGAPGGYASMSGYSSVSGTGGSTAGGGAGGVGQWGAYGGNGGNAGLAGSAGYSNSNVGQAGYAIRKNGNVVTVMNNGTVSGTIA
ncbi:hypothetical protein MMA231_04012 (plasmid) [Asticcacaulis sp. MM231]